jgi:hypothetical protein
VNAVGTGVTKCGENHGQALRDCAGDPGKGFLAAAKERHIFDNLPKVVPVSFAPFDAKNRRTEAVVEAFSFCMLDLAAK